MAELEKTILTVPELPAVVKGDGRYMMSLLRQFLRETAEQVNLANGFSAEEIYPSNDVQTPKNFFLSFDRLGARFTWDHIRSIDTLLYYELRTDENVGSDNGLLERTRETESMAVPVDFSADVYLYAVTEDGKASSPAKISYTKPRPEEPEDLALTKNNEGLLVTFLEIPTNCIGANVYVNGKKYVVYDNIFLYTGKDTVRIVEVAYFDSFGEGERATLVSYIPDVTGFLVERNGDSLDFYWDEIDAHGVQYVVKVGQTPVWETGIEVFRTKQNKKKHIFPRTGTFYFLIKALSEQGVYSENAAWVSTVSTIDINRNQILSYEQNSIEYSGSKVNMYYDAVGQTLALDRNVFYGEYLINVTLPQKYRARSWVDYQAASIAVDSETWDEALFSWDSAEGERVRWAGASAGIDAHIRTDIALKLDEDDIPAEILDNFSLNDTLVSDRGESPSESQNAGEYVSGRWGNGVYIANNTRISYQAVDFPAVFSTTLNVKVTEAMKECVFLTLRSADGWLMLGHSNGNIYLRGSDGGYIGISVGTLEREWLTLGIAQAEDKRTLFVKCLAQNRTDSKSQETVPIGDITSVFMYANIGGLT